MSSIKRISMEFGTDFNIVDVVLTDGDYIKVVGVADQDGKVTWVSEAVSRNEAAEDFALKAVKAMNMAVTNVITE